MVDICHFNVHFPNEPEFSQLPSYFSSSTILNLSLYQTFHIFEPSANVFLIYKVININIHKFIKRLSAKITRLHTFLGIKIMIILFCLFIKYPMVTCDVLINSMKTGKIL